MSPTSCQTAPPRSRSGIMRAFSLYCKPAGIFPKRSPILAAYSPEPDVGVPEQAQVYMIRVTEWGFFCGIRREITDRPYPVAKARQTPRGPKNTRPPAWAGGRGGPDLRN